MKQVTTNTGTRLELGQKAFWEHHHKAIYEVVQPDDFEQVVHVWLNQTSNTVGLKDKLEWLRFHSPIGADDFQLQDVLALPNYLTYHQNKMVGYTTTARVFFNENKHLAFNLRQILNNRQRPIYPSGGVQNQLLLLKIAYNLARAVNILHSNQQYVLVNWNPDFFLVKSDSKITLTDLHEIQIADHNNLRFAAQAHEAIYSPPEQAKIQSFRHTGIDRSWDYYAYALLIYELLLGVHPFLMTKSQEWQQSSNLTNKSQIRQHIQQGKWAAANTQTTGRHRGFNELPKGIKGLFHRCFATNQGHQQSKLRPAFDEWMHELLTTIRYLNQQQIKASNPNQLIDQVANTAPQAWIDGKQMTSPEPLTPPALRITGQERPPSIDFFDCEIDYRNVTLHWRVLHAAQVRINGERVVPIGTQVVPYQDGIYHLQAENTSGRKRNNRIKVWTIPKRAKPPVKLITPNTLNTYQQMRIWAKELLKKKPTPLDKQQPLKKHQNLHSFKPLKEENS